MTKRHLCWAMLSFAASGCATDEPETTELGEELNAFVGTIWTKSDIPVCWEVAGRDGEKAIVRDAIRRTWEAEANINFTGWGTCAATADGIRIEVADVNPHVGGDVLPERFGRDLDGMVNGMTLNFDYVSRPCDVVDKTACIRRHAVHEFGHALGFLHEANRADNPAWCDQQQRVQGDATVGAWDLQSVMNYCNPSRENGAQLSPTDIWGVQRFYGARKPLSAHQGAGRIAVGARTRFSNGAEQLATWNSFGGAFTRTAHGAEIASTPAIVTSGWRTHAIVRGTDGRLYGKVFDGASWSGFSQLGPEEVMGDPVAVARGTDSVDVFVRGTDRRLYWKSFNGAAWTGYAAVGAPGGTPLVAGNPAVVVRGPSLVDVFARSVDNILHYTSWNGSQWTGFAPLRPNAIASNPVAVSWAPHRIDVFVRGTDGGLYTINWNGWSWNGFYGLGGVFTGDPAVVARASDRLDIFVRGTDQNVWTMSWTGSAWTGFSPIIGQTPAGPSVTSSGANRMDLFVLGTDAALWKNTWNGSAWSGYTSQGGSIH